MEKALSQERLAEQANIHKNFVSEIERGKKSITIETLFQIATALNVNPETIIQELKNER
jgi:transcriptional regulator with XRE-family HTH domain